MRVINRVLRFLYDISASLIGPRVYLVKTRSYIVNDITIKVYLPKGGGKKPVIVYYHGGGWVIGSIKAYDSILRYMSYHADSIVVAIGYRKAPEYKFPAALQDAYFGYCWTVSNIAGLNGDVNRLILCGDSAGGNLVLGVLSMINGQKSAPLPYLSVLIYPLLEPTIVSASKRDLLYKISRRILNYSLRRYIGADTTGAQEISFISNFNENITYC
jgi:acetyl esterase